MADTYRFDSRTLFVALESTYNDNTALVGADAIRFIEGSATDNFKNVERKYDTEYLSASETLNIKDTTTVSGGIEIYASGTAATEAAWGRLVKACGHAVTIDSTVGAETVTYTPVSVDHDSAVFGFKHGPGYRLCRGARGNLSLDFSIDNFMRANLELTGIYATPVAPPGTSADYSAFRDPVLLTPENWAVMFNGVAVRTKQITMNRGVQLKAANASNNYREVGITGHAPTGTIRVYAPDLATFNPYALRDNNTKVTLLSLVGSAQYERVEFGAPAVAVTAVTEANEDGALVYDMTIRYDPVAGNDNYYLKQY